MPLVFMDRADLMKKGSKSSFISHIAPKIIVFGIYIHSFYKRSRLVAYIFYWIVPQFPQMSFTIRIHIVRFLLSP